jgi:hypothetical protein
VINRDGIRHCSQKTTRDSGGGDDDEVLNLGPWGDICGGEGCHGKGSKLSNEWSEWVDQAEMGNGVSNGVETNRSM